MENQTHKEKILDSAFKVFLQKGFNAGINEIIKEAGISKGALYHHFNSKNDLYYEAIRSHLFQRHKDYSFVYDQHLTFREKVSKILQTFFSNFLDKVNIFSDRINKGNSIYVLAEYFERTNMKNLLNQEFNELHKTFYQLFKENVSAEQKNISYQLLANQSVTLVKGYYFDFIFFTIEDIEKKLKPLENQILDLFNTYNPQHSRQ